MSFIYMKNKTIVEMKDQKSEVSFIWALCGPKRSSSWISLVHIINIPLGKQQRLDFKGIIHHLFATETWRTPKSKPISAHLIRNGFFELYQL